mmetsp:Transcript_70389/g.198653  ORF Transcript_70389/g.198653 Transcript_70389/m.198653 type:complete len:225 (+) Transcript_70389:817-1491(+)
MSMMRPSRTRHSRSSYRLLATARSLTGPGVSSLRRPRGRRSRRISLQPGGPSGRQGRNPSGVSRTSSKGSMPVRSQSCAGRRWSCTAGASRPRPTARRRWAATRSPSPGDWRSPRRHLHPACAQSLSGTWGRRPVWDSSRTRASRRHTCAPTVASPLWATMRTAARRTNSCTVSVLLALWQRTSRKKLRSATAKPRKSRKNTGQTTTSGGEQSVSPATWSLPRN